MIAAFRTALTMIVVGVMTVILALTVVIADALRVPRRKNGIYDRVPIIWSKVLLLAAGVKVKVFGRDKIVDGQTYIFTANHVSLFDIPSAVSVLPPCNFIAKRELFGIPFFGQGIRAIGTIPIERTNQKAAFGSYNVATERIRGGNSVVVFPEGTRGLSYEIRPFKKGPFVLGIQAGVPIVPCLIYGTIEVLPKKSLWLRPGRVEVHVLDPIPTEGLSYEDRGELAQRVNERMTAAMKQLLESKKSRS